MGRTGQAFNPAPLKATAILLVLLPFWLGAAVHRVSSAGTLRSAVEQAQPGDTIYVVAGQYAPGNLVLTKPLTLIGQGRPVLSGESQHEILTIAASDVVVQGFHFQNSGRSSLEDIAAIKCLDAHRVRVVDNVFSNTFFGIHLSNTNGAFISQNKLESSAEHEYQLGNGIHLWKCRDAVITHNHIRGHRDGIYFEFVTHSRIEHNRSEYNVRYGLHFMFSNDDTYSDNTFTGNGAGVSVMYSKSVRMYRNVFENNWGNAAYGMLLKDIRDSEVLHNHFVNNTSGIYMEGSSRILFESNTFRGNGWAIKLMASCDDNVIRGNNFLQNTFDIATNGSLVLNNIDGNYWDKYQGYDLNRDAVGDVPHHPVSLFTTLVEQVPAAMMLWRSFMAFLLDYTERVLPAVTPENLNDRQPKMKPHDFR